MITYEQRNDSIGFYLYDNGKEIGHVEAFINEKKKDCLVLKSIWVCTEHRKKGIWQTLFKKLHHTVLNDGYSGLVSDGRYRQSNAKKAFQCFNYYKDKNDWYFFKDFNNYIKT